MRSGIYKSVAIVSILLLWNTSYAIGNKTEGQKKSTTCAACHGANGVSASQQWPNLAGQGEKYLYRQLIEFKKGKTGERFNATMTPLVTTLSDQDLQDLAAYFSSLPNAKGQADKKLLEKGQQLYRGGDRARNVVACIACHGPQGLGNNEAAFPVLSGQHVEYLVDELQDYKAGTRTTDTNGVMRDIASKLTEDDMKAVTSYVSGLH